MSLGHRDGLVLKQRRGEWGKKILTDLKKGLKIVSVILKMIIFVAVKILQKAQYGTIQDF